MSEPLADATIHTDDQCLASALFYEARGEKLVGKKAVLEVIEHRMLDTGKSACAIIKQQGQFSWLGKKPIRRYNAQLKEMLTEVKEAPKVLINERYKWFFSRRIRPLWSYKLSCKPLGNHVFCKEKTNESRK